MLFSFATLVNILVLQFKHICKIFILCMTAEVVNCGRFHVQSLSFMTSFLLWLPQVVQELRANLERKTTLLALMEQQLKATEERMLHLEV